LVNIYTGIMSIVITNKTHRGSVAYNEIRLDFKGSDSQTYKNEEIALNKLTIYYSWRNILSEYNNNKLSYIYNGVTYDITIPDCFFTINDINNYLQLKMKQNGHFTLDSEGSEVYYIDISENLSYYSCTINLTKLTLPISGSNPNAMVLSGNTMQLVLPASFNELLGFNAGTYPATPSATNYGINSHFVPIITKVSSIIVTCSIASNNTSQYSDMIYIFSPNDTYGKLLREVSENLTWYNVFDGNYKSISIKFYDQDYNPLKIIDKDSLVCNLISRKRVN